MKKKAFILDDDDITLIRTLLWKHRDYAISKRRFYEYCNCHGEYNHIITECKKMFSRYEKLLFILKVER